MPIDGAAAATFALVFAAIVSLGASEGGYFPSSWGWSAFVFAVVGLLALLTRDRIELSRLELSYLGAFTALLTWTALSLLWTDTVTQTMFEVERTLSYVMFAVALALVARRTSAHLVVAATLAGITVISAYALATRLLPDTLTVYDPIGRNRLADPLGYWNALGAFAAVGCVLALGFAARADRTWLRGLSASALVVLGPTMFFTFSRGGWVALFIGVAVLIALDPRRLQTVTVLFVVLPWPALAVLIASRSSALTTVGSPLADATDEGRRLLAVILLLGVVTFLSVVGLAALERRFDPAPWVRRAYGASLVGIALVVVAVGVVALGGPTAIKHRATTSIHRVSPDESGDQTQRLFSLSAHGRLELWATAIDEAQARPVLGGGAGSFEQWWYAHRRVEATVRDAHNLYLETAAELGLVGLGLLVALLALPFIRRMESATPPRRALRMRSVGDLSRACGGGLGLGDARVDRLCAGLRRFRPRGRPRNQCRRTRAIPLARRRRPRRNGLARFRVDEREPRPDAGDRGAREHRSRRDDSPRPRRGAVGAVVVGAVATAGGCGPPAREALRCADVVRTGDRQGSIELGALVRARARERRKPEAVRAHPGSQAEPSLP